MVVLSIHLGDGCAFFGCVHCKMLVQKRNVLTCEDVATFFSQKNQMDV